MSGVPSASGPRWVPGTFLDRLAPESRTRLLELGVSRRIEAGRRLLREGAEERHVELLTWGFVKVTTIVDGFEALLAIRVPGDILGETAAVTGRPRTATVTACGDIVSTVVRLPAFRRFLDQHPDAAVQLTASMGERLRWANTRRTDFARYPVEVRMARVLAELAVTCGRPVADGIEITVALTQTELATMVGAAETTAQKAMRDLRQAGLIRSGYRRVTVLDLPGLRALVPDMDA